MGSDAGTESAARTSRVSAELLRQLSGLALPAVKQAMSANLEDLGQPGSVPASVTRAFGAARESVNRDFDTANARGAATIQQATLQSGGAYSPDAVGRATEQFVDSVARDRANTLRALRFQEANAGMNQSNLLLSQLIGQSGTLSSGAMGFGQNALQSSQLLSQLSAQRRQQGSTYGAIAGTILGGALGAAGTFGLGTAAGAAAGGALGGAVGGYFGGG